LRISEAKEKRRQGGDPQRENSVEQVNKKGKHDGGFGKGRRREREKKKIRTHFVKTRQHAGTLENDVKKLVAQHKREINAADEPKISLPLWRPSKRKESEKNEDKTNLSTVERDGESR